MQSAQKAYTDSPMMNLHMSQHFRHDIEGLRAIAVLLVIAAHFAIPGFAGGFVGVDIFFVISGYLITSILLREQQSSGTIQLGRFYANRLRRLLPALATMLIISSLLASQLLHESQYLEQGPAAAMAAIWASNIHFSFADIDYFADEAANNALLHTWSLGVEEQFYLVWPLFILLMTHWAARRQNRSTAIWFFSAVALASFVACIATSTLAPKFAFYMMPTRAWQFATGALAWLLVRSIAPSQTQAAIASWAGLLMLLTSVTLIGPDSVYPGILALLPTLATALLLWAGAAPISTPAAKMLALRPMQALGRLSYSWYLWHWPILVIGEHLIPIKGHALNTLLAIAISLLAAMLTHYLVERPVRYGTTARLPPKWQLVMALCTMVLLNSQLLRWHNSTERRLTDGHNDAFAHAMADAPVIYQHGCDTWYHDAELKPCIYGPPSAEKTAVLMGDSIGAQWFSALAAMLDPQKWRIIVLTKSSCPMVDEPYFYKRIGREYTECAIWREKAIGWLQQQHVDRLFIGSTASNSFSDTQWREGTRRILDRLEQSASAIYLIEANPKLSFNGPRCLMQNGIEHQSDCQEAAGPAQYQHVAALLKALTESHPKTHWLATSSLVCPKGQCQAMRDGVVVFRDAQHLTASFVTSLAPGLLEQIQPHEQVMP